MPNTIQDLIPSDWVDPAEYIPPELQLDDDHPDQDEYSQALREIDQKIFAVGKMLKPKRRELVRLARAGMSAKDIAKKLDVSVKSVYTWAKRPDVIRYGTLLDYHTRKIDGANESHRKGVLWRIAMDNELTRPNISVQCIQEINKMSGVYNTDNVGNQGNVVNISINGELLPRGSLDVMPETFETRQAKEAIEGTAHQVKD